MYGKVEIRCRIPIGDWLYARKQIHFKSFHRVLLWAWNKRSLISIRSLLRNHSSVGLNGVNKQFRAHESAVCARQREATGRSRGGRRAACLWRRNLIEKSEKQWQMAQGEVEWLHWRRWRTHITVGAFFFFILQSKAFPKNHLGTDFHVYELMWTPSEISLFIDGINYGSLNSNLRESAMSAKIKSAVNWANNGPFDKEVKAIRASRVANQISSKLTLFILPNSTFYP